MIRDAVLQIHHPEIILAQLGGMTIFERQLFLLSRAGIRKTWIFRTRPAGIRPRLPAEMEVFWEAEPKAVDFGNETAHLVVSGNHLFRAETLRRILANASSAICYRDEAVDEAARIVIHEERSPHPPPHRTLKDGSCLSLEKIKDPGKRMSWLLDGARKKGDGMMARYFDRYISLGVTRRLLNTRMLPNHMTLISTGIGLTGALQFLLHGRAHALAGAVLIWLHTVLDGCDGEMARLTFRESRWGAFLDFWGDNAVHFALFACLASAVAHDDPRALIYGFFACLGTLASAWFTARRLRDFPGSLTLPSNSSSKETVGDTLNNQLEKVEILLAQRDFIYLLLLSVLFNQTTWFLRTAGIGAPLYFSLLLYVHRRTRPSPAFELTETSLETKISI